VRGTAGPAPGRAPRPAQGQSVQGEPAAQQHGARSGQSQSSCR